MTSAPSINHIDDPEMLLAVDHLSITDGVASGSTVLSSLHEFNGQPLVGGLGVLVDDVLGRAILARRPEEHWSTSTEIRIELFRRMPVSGDRVEVSGTCDVADQVGALAVGHLHHDGVTVGSCTHRARFIPSRRSRSRPTSHIRHGQSLDHSDLLSRLGASMRETGYEELGLALVVTQPFQNPLMTLHGGVSLAASDLVANALAARNSLTWMTTSIQMTYLRPVQAELAVAFQGHVVHEGRTLSVIDVVGLAAGSVATLARVTLEPRDHEGRLEISSSRTPLHKDATVQPSN